MEFEETHRLSLLGFDEKSETWFVQPRESQRLMLTRHSLARLVHLYNSIHKGNALVLLEQRELRQLEEARQRQSEMLRDLHLLGERKRRRAPLALLGRLLGALSPSGSRRAA